MNSKHAAYQVVLGVVLGLLSIASFAFTLGRLSVDALLFLSVVALAGMTLLGVFVSLHPDRSWVKQRRTAISLIFGILGVAGALVASFQGLRANRVTFGIQDQLGQSLAKIAAQETELTRTRAELAKLREESARAQALNTDLQRKLLDQSSQLKDLAVQRVAEVTGGDGFAYLDLGNSSNENGVALQAHVSGSYNLRQVKYRIAEGSLVEIGDLTPRSPRPLDATLAGGRYKIVIQAANGPVQEELELRFNPAGKRWERRVRVSRGGEVVLERSWGR
ncbi:MAG: hypothetical protein K2X03_13125 [Bryobacteraceae bacterium]|nr:hypothetical protein [Bryobacteraceae bacterium]